MRLSLDDVQREVLTLLRTYREDHFSEPEAVYLPSAYAKVLLRDFIDRVSGDVDARRRLTDLGLAAVYGGSLYGMEIRRTEDGPPWVGARPHGTFTLRDRPASAGHAPPRRHPA